MEPPSDSDEEESSPRPQVPWQNGGTHIPDMAILQQKYFEPLKSEAKWVAGWRQELLRRRGGKQTTAPSTTKGAPSTIDANAVATAAAKVDEAGWLAEISTADLERMAIDFLGGGVRNFRDLEFATVDFGRSVEEGFLEEDKWEEGASDMIDAAFAREMTAGDNMQQEIHLAGTGSPPGVVAVGAGAGHSAVRKEDSPVAILGTRNLLKAPAVSQAVPVGTTSGPDAKRRKIDAKSTKAIQSADGAKFTSDLLASFSSTSADDLRTSAATALDHRRGLHIAARIASPARGPACAVEIASQRGVSAMTTSGGGTGSSSTPVGGFRSGPPKPSQFVKNQVVKNPKKGFGWGASASNVGAVSGFGAPVAATVPQTPVPFGAASIGNPFLGRVGGRFLQSASSFRFPKGSSLPPKSGPKNPLTNTDHAKKASSKNACAGDGKKASGGFGDNDSEAMRKPGNPPCIIQCEVPSCRKVRIVRQTDVKWYFKDHRTTHRFQCAELSHCKCADPADDIDTKTKDHWFGRGGRALIDGPEGHIPPHDE